MSDEELNEKTQVVQNFVESIRVVGKDESS